jgi:hypothetical protein
VPLSREAPNAGVGASGRRDVPLTAELDAPQTRSMTAAIAWPNPMHIVASP